MVELSMPFRSLHEICADFTQAATTLLQPTSSAFSEYGKFALLTHLSQKDAVRHREIETDELKPGNAS
jgi:hypothetical protein